MRRAQSMTELIILIAMILVATAWLTLAVPKAMRGHYEGVRDVIASPH